MSGTQELKQELDSWRTDLLNAMVQAKDRAAIGKANAEKAAVIDDEIEKYEQTRVALVRCSEHMSNIYKNIMDYAERRRKLSLNMLRTAIERAAAIVPDADVKGITLETSGNTAKIVNATGQDINLREGSAYRTVMGNLIRYALLKLHPNAIQAIFYDEAFTTLSDETANAQKEDLIRFAEDTLIVGIEQRGYMFDGVKCKTLRAVKGEDKITEIIEED